ncbi:MAG: citrate lyase acyl carrier protein [Synergistaceae bacterium]|nr:citrate lyase acyl carrier protein [Synergistaceae bacterium]
MEVVKTAIAGTLESSDVQITIEPNGNGTAVDISSIVLNQYGRQIKAIVLDTLNTLGVKSAKVTVVDKGALDCTIKARTECAVYRAAGFAESFPWGGEKQ